jgi:phage FluMu gp28-like protein
MINARNFCGCAKVIPKDTLLLDYQAKWVKDQSRLKIAEKSRQIGWSWAEAYRIVRNKSLVDAALDQWISSRDEIQARLFLEDCKSFAAVLQIGAKDLGEKAIDEKGNTAYTIQFANGLRANSMSSNPDAQAGKRGGRTLDEFALHADPRKLYSIAYPGITWGGDIAIFSTHRGTANYFNQLILEARHKGNPKGFSLHRVTLQDALDQGFLYKLQQKLPQDDERQGMDEAAYFDFIRKGCADSETFLQEYMCVPDDDASAFLSFDLIDGCKYKPGEKWEMTLEELAGSPNPLYLGVDVGRKHDLTSFWLDEKISGTSFCRLQIDLKAMAFSQQESILYPILALPNLRRACFDNTGIGMQFAERAQERFGKYKIEPVTFTPAVKEELAYPVKAAFEDKTLRIPDRKEVVSDFRGIRKETTTAGNVRFSGERSETGHCDRFWAKALASHASKNSSGNYFAQII